MNHNKNNCKCPCHGPYEVFDEVYEDSISHYLAPLDELNGGQLFVNINSISEEERNELSKRFGPKHDIITEGEV